jgi:hypothetical protein
MSNYIENMVKSDLKHVQHRDFDVQVDVKVWVRFAACCCVYVAVSIRCCARIRHHVIIVATGTNLFFNNKNLRP